MWTLVRGDDIGPLCLDPFIKLKESLAINFCNSPTTPSRYIKSIDFLLLDLKFLFKNFLPRPFIFFVDIAIEWAI
jgi:hypothetical protein